MNSKPHIFLIFFDLGLGGEQKKIIDLANRLTPFATTHIVIKNHSSFSFKKLLNKAVILEIPNPWFRKIKYSFCIFLLYKIIQFRPSFLFTCLTKVSIMAIIASWLTFWQQKKVIISQGNILSYEEKNKVLNFLNRLIFPYAHTIIVQTKYAKGDLIEKFNIPSSKIVIIPNWTQVYPLKPNPNKLYDLVYCGRFTSQKNLLTLLNVVVRLKQCLPTIQVALYGEGQEKSLLVSYIKNHHLESNVMIKPPVLNIISVLDQSKIFVLTSLYEGQPLALIEAMGRALPSVVLRYPGVEEYLQHGKTGFIAKNEAEMVKYTLQLLSDFQISIQIGHNAYKMVKQKYSYNCIQEHLKLFGFK